MTAQVLTLHGRCQKCKTPHGAAERTVLDRLCDPCFEVSVAFMAEEKKLFEALLARGIDRETANVMMIAKHEHERQSSPHKRPAGGSDE